MTFLISILQAALVSTFAISEPEFAAPEPDEIIEPGDEAIERSPAPYCGSRGLECTMSGQTSTGRQWGCVTESTTAGVCIRWAEGGTAPRYYPSCHDRGRSDLGCHTVITR